MAQIVQQTAMQVPRETPNELEQIQTKGWKIPPAPQDTEQWRLDRCGSVGASEIADATRRLKNGSPAATRASLMARKVAERLTGRPVRTFQSQAMLEGLQKEPMARAAYELKYGVAVTETGIVKHPSIQWTHASPDGFVGDDCVLEIKCPEHAAHLDTLLKCSIDPDYYIQIQWQMECAERRWAHFVSYHPDFPPSMQMYVQKITWDQGLAQELRIGVITFLEEIEIKLKDLRQQYGETP
jgi:putative phage-type endonuclease